MTGGRTLGLTHASTHSALTLARDEAFKKEIDYLVKCTEVGEEITLD